MVKNTGGNKAKGFARKHTNGGKKDMLRVSEDEGEIYSVVTKMCGNSMFECMGIDRVSRLGHIRGKFSGKGKRDNIVQNGIWVLIGVREWDIKKDEGKKEIDKKKAKLPQCDLLEVYNDLDKERLKDTVAEKWSILMCHDESSSKDIKKDNDVFEFTNDQHEESNKILEELANNTTKVIDFKNKENANDWINIDDI